MSEDLTIAADASPRAREVWWSGRRRRYNVSLVIAGLAGFACYAIAVQRCIELHAPGDWEITIFTTVVQGFAYVVAMGVANICYFLGPWAERVVEPRNVATFRTIAFRLGVWFSVLLSLTPSAVLFVACSLHRGEERRIILELISATFGRLA
jgi:quinol-cytochrome oxidoreductase complex cytochrome b subunit